jgi:hypothetical protein
MSELKKEKFFRHIDNCMKQDEKGELVDLTDIYEDHDSPPYKSPKRVLHYPRGKELIEHEIRQNNMEVEKVIRYENDRVYGNYQLTLEYLSAIDAFNKYMIIKLVYMHNPNILEEFWKFQEKQ